MVKNYEGAYKASVVAAKDILRTQMAGRILERIAKASADLITSIRHYAVVMKDQAKLVKDETEKATKRTEEREAFDDALAATPGITPEELSAAQEALATERAENDKTREDSAKNASEARTKELEDAAKRIADDKTEVTRLQDQLGKVQSGELKVDKEELKTLANELTEKALSEGAVDAIIEAGEESQG